MAKLLNAWYISIRDQQVEKAKATKEEIDEKLSRLEQNQNLLLYYQLLEFRYSLMMKQKKESKELLNRIMPDKTKTDSMLSYYYHFFKGIYCYNSKQYEDAIKEYHKAEKKLTEIPDPIEEAEFHYKVASVYFQHLNMNISIHHALKALKIFNEDSHYQKRAMDCKILLGANNTSLYRFEHAEVYFHEALKDAQDLKNSQSEHIVLHNLGWMYAKQGLSLEALQYLKRSLQWLSDNQSPKQVVTLYLIAKESFKVDEMKDGMDYVDKGIDVCGEINNQEYLHRLYILKAQYKNDQPGYLRALENGVSYFVESKLWEHVEEYASTLAKLYKQNGEYEKAVTHYELVMQAKERLNPKGV